MPAIPSLRRSALALLLALGATGTAVAQFTGPGARAPESRPVARTVAEVLADPADDRPVDLTGQLLRQTGRELYLFKDATGEITVEIDDEDFPANQPVGPEARVRISGEVDTRILREPRIDAERLQVLAATPSQGS